MLTGGHIAASYLIAESAKSIGIPLSNNQILTTILIGNIPDVDFFIGFITGKTGEKHHQNITHTPLGMLLIWILILVPLKPEVGFALTLLMSLVTHLVLDDLGHWIYKFKPHKFPVGSQINWLYPFTQFSKHRMIIKNNEALKTYFVKAWPVAFLEAVTILTAVVVYIIKN